MGGEGASSLARANALPQNDFRTEWNRTFSPFCANKQTKRETETQRMKGSEDKWTYRGFCKLGQNNGIGSSICRRGGGREGRLNTLP